MASEHGTPVSMQSLLKHMLAKPENVTPELVSLAFEQLFSGTSTPAQTAAFLVGLKQGNREHDPAVVAACAKTMREAALQIPFDPVKDADLMSEMVDIVGTGGDGHNTFNVSTAAGIVAAGAGCVVSKHGNRAATSQAGSADTLEALGAQLTKLTPAHVPQILRTSRFCFLFAQTFHPSMRHVAPVRREIGVRTVFNMLGPLTNPSRPRKMVIGVHSKELGRLMAEALLLDGAQRALVVNGAEGLDEISPDKETHVWSLENGAITELTISPSTFGLPSHPLSSMTGGAPAVNAQTMRDVLSGRETGPVRDFVLMNAGALLYVAGKAADMKEGVEVARKSIESGAAARALEAFVTASSQAL